MRTPKSAEIPKFISYFLSVQFFNLLLMAEAGTLSSHLPVKH